MRQTITLIRIAGIPVGLHWSALIILMLLVQGLAVVVLPAAVDGYQPVAYWLAGAGLTGLFAAALLAHEVAHALTARHFGVRVRAITLWLLGGVSELDGEPPHPRAAVLIAVAGPLTSVAAAGLFAGGAALAALAGGGLAHLGLLWLAGLNALIAAFNMLPGAPLDGGRVLAAVLWKIRGDRARAQRAAAGAGAVLGAALAVTGVILLLATGNLSGLWLTVLGWFLAGSARSEAASVRLRGSLDGLRSGQAMTAGPACGYQGQSVAAFVAEVAGPRPHHAYPVVDLDGRLSGLVVLSRLSTVPPALRATTRLAEVRTPLAAVPVVGPDTPLLTAAAAVAAAPPLAVVVSDGRPSGVLTAGDVRRCLAVAEAGGMPDRRRSYVVNGGFP